MKFLITVTNFIFNIYNNFIYVGDMEKMHPKGYAKEHSIIIISFLLSTNVLFLRKYFSISFIDVNVRIAFTAIAISIYLFNRYFIFPKLTDISLTFFEYLVPIIYIIGSLVLLFV